MSTTLETYYTHDGEELEVNVSSEQKMEMIRGLEVLKFFSDVCSASERSDQARIFFEYIIELGVVVETVHQERVLMSAIGSAIVSSHYYLELEHTRKARRSEHKKAIARRSADIKYNKSTGNYEEAARLESYAIPDPVLSGELHKFDMNVIELALCSEFDQDSIKIILTNLKKIAKAKNLTPYD